MSRQLLGILTLYLNDSGVLEERAVYEQMTKEADSLELDLVIFTPQDIIDSQQKVNAHYFHLESGKWKRKRMKIPQLIFDRSRFQKSQRYLQLKKFRKKYAHLHFLNKPIGNKWVIHNALLKSEAIKPYLPQTKNLLNKNDIKLMLKKYPVIYVKPINGTGGRGILKIEKVSKALVSVQGRDHNRKIISARKLNHIQLNQFFEKWNSIKANYILQQGIPLNLDNGRVHDYRLLMQKDGNGTWQVTGCAGRIGAARSVTANLHGGGEAMEMEKLMSNFIDNRTNILDIQYKVYDLGLLVSEFIEKEFSKLCELAIDIAIDKNGSIYIIEINPKPAREIFKKIGQMEIYQRAIRRPLEYALWYAKQIQ